jgi:tetratricopeptide (TPR) repeat protein
MVNQIQRNGRQPQQPNPSLNPTGSLPPAPQAPSVKVALRRAEAGLKAGNWREAIALCRQVIQVEPTGEAYRLMGNAMVGAGRWQEAQAAYEQALQRRPEWAEVYANLGTLALQREAWLEGLQYYRQALGLKPELTGLTQSIEQVWDRLAQSQQTLKTVEAELAKEPQRYAAIDHLMLGDCWAKQEEWQQAADGYERAIEIEPEMATACWNLSVVRRRLGDRDGFTTAYFRALSLQPDWATATEHCQLGQEFLQREDWGRAIDCFRWAIERDGAIGEAQFGLGVGLQQQGDLEGAGAAYRQVIQQDASHWQAYHNLGEVLSKLEHWNEAVKAYRRAIELNPEHSWSHNNLGDALMRLERWEEAVGAFERAIELKDDFHWSHFNLGEALVRLGRWDEAIAAYRNTTELQPELAKAHRQLSTALCQRAQSDLIIAFESYQHLIRQDPSDIESYHRAIEIKKDDPELYAGLADALTRNNQLDEAIVCYQLALQIKPEDSGIKARLNKALYKKKQLAEGLGFAVQSATYALWLRENAPKLSDLVHLSKKAKALKYKPLISIIVPVYNSTEVFLKEMLQSVLDQVYPYWELCIADDASLEPYVRRILEEYAARDQRIKITFRTQNGHISVASNSALKLATGEFITLLDHDDLLTPDALYEVAELLNAHPEADMIYSDEDKINEERELLDPYFKPDWCPDLLLSQNYICHLGTYRRKLINQIGGFRIGYEGSQDYDLVLRFTEKTNNIFHIPKVLYHWRVHSASAASGGEAKPYAYESGAKALQDALNRRGETGRVIPHLTVPGVYTVRYSITDDKLVSIIIPTRNLGDVLNRCLHSLFEKSTYPNYEVIVIDNGSDQQETLAIFDFWRQHEPQRFRCYRLDIPFNYSKLNNYGVFQAKGDYLLFLNNDTEVVTPDWIEAMVEQAQRPSIGAVGARLLYPDDTIQHSGVILGIGGVAGHGHKHVPYSSEGYFRQLLCVSNYSAVTAACMMCRRSAYEQSDGFDETLKVAFNDVDFCLKLQQQGYRNLCLPHVLLYHHESKSRGAEDTPEKQKRFQQEIEAMQNRWGELLINDPCYSPNLTREHENYSLRLVTRPKILEILLAKSTETEDDFWEFSLDEPLVGLQDTGSIRIAGWAVGRRSKITAIEVICNGQVIHHTSINTLREDVGEIFSHISGAEESGFTTVIDVTDLPTKVELCLQAVFVDNHRSVLGSIKLQY